jgi:acetyltransferase-like isoleucine patch superfamily enzyme
MRCPLELNIDASADIARRVEIELHARAPVRLTIGPGAHLQPGVVLRLGGDLEIGELSELRYGVIVNVKGRLLLTGRCMLGRGTTVHCDGDMVWEWGVITGEYVSVIDSNHVVDGSPIHPHDQPNVVAPVRLGACCWIGAHATVTAGVTIGAASIVGANSVASRDVPPGVAAVGAPARPLKDLPGAFLQPAR